MLVKKIFNGVRIHSQYSVEWKKQGAVYDMISEVLVEQHGSRQNVNRVCIWIVGLWGTFISFIFQRFLQ